MIHMGMTPPIPPGSVFGRLTVLSFSFRGHKRLYLCMCECGNETSCFSNDLTRGHSGSCGCLQRSKTSEAKRRYPGHPAVNRLIGDYKRKARNKNREWSLTHEEATLMLSSPCSYCGQPPDRKQTCGKTSLLVSGIDRKDSSMGYTLANCVPCCEICNKAKRDLPEESWEAWLDRITSFRSS